MSDNVENVTLDVLKTIQASIAELRTDMRAGFEELRLQSAKERRNSAGTLVMMRATAGHFALRVEDIEARVAALEARA